MENEFEGKTANELEGVSLKNRKPEPTPGDSVLNPEPVSKIKEPAKKTNPLIIAVGIIAGIGLVGAATWAVLEAQNNTTSVVPDVTTAITATTDDSVITLQNGTNKITAAGTYTVTGSITGKIAVDCDSDVTLILQNVTITNPEGAAIKSKGTGKLTVVLEGENTLSATGTEDPAAAISGEAAIEVKGDGSVTIKSTGKGIKAETTLTLTSGTYNIDATDDAIHTNGDMVIENGTYTIKTDDDGIHADSKLTINDGTFTITAHEGIEATYIIINGGTITISASDDGINAAQKVNTYTATIEINGGTITIKMGQGDTDGLDSNGNIYINGGTVDITGQSPCDYDGEAKLSSSATLITNGTQVTTIPNQFGGEGGGMMNGGQQMQGDEMQGGGQQTRGRMR